MVGSELSFNIYFFLSLHVIGPHDNWLEVGELDNLRRFLTFNSEETLGLQRRCELESLIIAQLIIHLVHVAND